MSFQMSIGSRDLGRLLGREDELRLLTSLLDGVEGGGGAFVLRGGPGVGKSRLPSEAAALARDRGFGALNTTGVQFEAHLTFAGLHRCFVLCGQAWSDYKNIAQLDQFDLTGDTERALECKWWS